MLRVEVELVPLPLAGPLVLPVLAGWVQLVPAMVAEQQVRPNLLEPKLPRLVGVVVTLVLAQLVPSPLQTLAEQQALGRTLALQTLLAVQWFRRQELAR